MIRCAALVLAIVSAAPASAQVRFRRPYAETYRLSYGFDNNGGSAGCADYTCAGACYDGHSGSDFALPYGTNVLAAASGRVIARFDGCADTGFLGSTCGGRCGNYVQVEHSDGSRTIYCHMRRGSIAVAVGERVSCGERIGQSASSGNSTGAHLHFGWRPSGSSVSRDPFAGRCSRATSLWTAQRGYREAPGAMCMCTPATEACNGRDDDCDGRVDESLTRACSTACGSGRETCSRGAWGGCTAREPVPEVCNGEDDDCDGRVDDGDVCEVDLLHEQPSAYAPPRLTDVDGDGRADVCARGVTGVRCWLAQANGWSAATPEVSWADDRGWRDPTNYATLRMGDLDGDGRADLCARANDGVTCALSLGDGFDAARFWLDVPSDANGWNEARHYTTLRLADVDGDGRDDLCGRGAEGFDCWLSDGASFAERVEGPRFGDADGFERASRYGTIRMGDVDGDRRADVCARTSEGMECWLAADRFATRVEGPRWSDADGWRAMERWSTVRLADVDGDGRSDLCARSAEALVCAFSTGRAFAEPLVVATLSDTTGWGDRSNYATLRTGDLDGDGAEDLCIRADAGLRCYAYDGTGFVRRDGPGWSDDTGWDVPRYYQTIRLADVDGDGMEDACARASDGWRCHRSRDDGTFDEPLRLGEMDDAGGWDEVRYYSTILSGGRACRPEAEACNGRDDDCDGAIDEDASAETCNGADDDCDGRVDEGPRCARPDGSLGGPPASLSGSCGCRAARGADGLGWLALVLLAVARRRRSS